MLTFQGNNMINDGFSNGLADLGRVLNIESTRIRQLADLMNQYKKDALVEIPAGKAFDFGKLLKSVDVDVDSPNELLFIGMCIGRAYGEATERAAQMMAQALTSPAGLLALLASSVSKAAAKDAQGAEQKPEQN